MTNSDDPIRQQELELKVRELYQKQFSDAQRAAVDFSKLIVTNFIWINAAGQGSLPVSAVFLGIGDVPWPQKFPLMFGPGLGFAGGLFSGLICALATYYNFDAIAKNADFAIGEIRLTHPTTAQNEEFKGKVEAHRDRSAKFASAASTRIWATLIISHLLGWISLFCFLFADPHDHRRRRGLCRAREGQPQRYTMRPGAGPTSHSGATLTPNLRPPLTGRKISPFPALSGSNTEAGNGRLGIAIIEQHAGKLLPKLYGAAGGSRHGRRLHRPTQPK